MKHEKIGRNWPNFTRIKIFQSHIILGYIIMEVRSFSQCYTLFDIYIVDTERE